MQDLRSEASYASCASRGQVSILEGEGPVLAFNLHANAAVGELGHDDAAPAIQLRPRVQ